LLREQPTRRWRRCRTRRSIPANDVFLVAEALLGPPVFIAMCECFKWKWYDDHGRPKAVVFNSRGPDGHADTCSSSSVTTQNMDIGVPAGAGEVTIEPQGFATLVCTRRLRRFIYPSTQTCITQTCITHTCVSQSLNQSFHPSTCIKVPLGARLAGSAQILQGPPVCCHGCEILCFTSTSQLAGEVGAHS
jgi:hypothetical protein